VRSSLSRSPRTAPVAEPAFLFIDLNRSRRSTILRPHAGDEILRHMGEASAGRCAHRRTGGSAAMSSRPSDRRRISIGAEHDLGADEQPGGALCPGEHQRSDRCQHRHRDRARPRHRRAVRCSRAPTSPLYRRSPAHRPFGPITTTSRSLGLHDAGESLRDSLAGTISPHYSPQTPLAATLAYAAGWKHPTRHDPAAYGSCPGEQTGDGALTEWCSRGASAAPRARRGRPAVVS